MDLDKGLSTGFMRLFHYIGGDNELGTKIVELDARPSDCLAIASAQKIPTFVAADLFEQVEDMTEFLERINEGASEESEE